jgi:hypothetical protein
VVISSTIARAFALRRCWYLVAASREEPRGKLSASTRDASPDEAAQKEAFAVDLLLGCGGEARLGSEPAVACTVDGKALKLTPATAEDGVLDLAKTVARQDYAIAYAVTTVESPDPVTAVLAVGSDGAVKVWLNDDLVHENWVQRGLQKDQDVVALKLRRGRNRLVMKLENGTAAWGLAARLLGPRGIEAAVWRAAKDGAIGRIQALLAAHEGADLDAKPEYGVTAWQIGRAFGRTEAAQLLAAKGADTALPLPAPEALVDAILTEATRGRSPGAAVLVSQGGKILLERGCGYADLERSVKITPATKFRIGSISKQFTATAILRLEEQGRLELTDPPSKYIPGFPKGDEITLRHLLTHTSGLGDHTKRPDFLKNVTTPTDLTSLIASFKDDGFEFEPGTRFAYCNSGYVLLGYVIERVSGQSYGASCGRRSSSRWE